MQVALAVHTPPMNDIKEKNIQVEMVLHCLRSNGTRGSKCSTYPSNVFLYLLTWNARFLQCKTLCKNRFPLVSNL